MTSRAKHNGAHPRTLAIDIGGTGLKAAILDHAGDMSSKRVRVATPYPCPPEVMVRTLVDLITPLPVYDRISIGFPGVIRAGQVVTAPHFGNAIWHGYPLEAELAQRLKKPVRLLNDAEVQGLGIVAGHGLEVVLTLGTGIGSAVFDNGRVAPHLELAQHPIHKCGTYNDYLGNSALQSHGKKKWNRRVVKMISIVQTLLNFDLLYLGGGNSARVTTPLPANVHIASNDTGLTGGIRLWDEHVWHAISGDRYRYGEMPEAMQHRTTRHLQRMRHA